jgi:TolB-like protein/Tfp pilus assembly protein PilF
VSFFSELRRRNVFKVGAAYAIVSWLLVQVADTFFPALRLPEWTVSLVAGLVILGFPLALLLSWAYELTPGGMERTGQTAVAEGRTRLSGRKLDRVIMALLVLVVAFMAIDSYVLQRGTQEPSAMATASTRTPTPVEDDAETTVLPNSIAVLPFENLSPDPNNDFFAASVHEEILTQLGIIRGLSVIGRTSVRQYAGAARPITEIARELNVESIMEGSIAYGEGRVVVSARLIDSATGTRLWGDRYNNVFENIFEIQADIAMNIANALEAEFSPAEQERIEQVPTDSPAAYVLYLRARDIPFTAPDLLEQAISLDPEFALAHALKAYVYAAEVEGTSVDPTEAATLVRVAREAAERALMLDSTLGLAHSALANLHLAAGDLSEAEAAYRQALDLSPSDSNVLALYSRFKRYVGEYDEAINLSHRSVELDPNNPFSIIQLAFSHWYALEYEAAASAFQRYLALDPTNPIGHLGVAFVEVSRKNEEEALRQLQFAEQLWQPEFPSLRLGQLAFAYGQMGLRQEAERFFGRLRELGDEEPIAEAVWAMAYFATGEYDQAFQRLESAISNSLPGDEIALSELKANPYDDSVLKETPWQELRDRIGAL